MASDRYQFISSRFVKEIGQLGGDVAHFVSPRVAAELVRKFGDARAVAEAFERKIAAKNG
jgi:pantetheine-phosphate adenylyltransferase